MPEKNTKEINKRELTSSGAGRLRRSGFLPHFQSGGSLESVMLRTCWETDAEEMAQVVNLVGSLGPLRWHSLWLLIWRGRMRRLIQAHIRSSAVGFCSASSFSMYDVIVASITNRSGVLPC